MWLDYQLRFGLVVFGAIVLGCRDPFIGIAALFFGAALIHPTSLHRS
jgi:hypothetical protein